MILIYVFNCKKNNKPTHEVKSRSCEEQTEVVRQSKTFFSSASCDNLCVLYFLNTNFNILCYSFQ